MVHPRLAASSLLWRGPFLFLLLRGKPADAAADVPALLPLLRKLSDAAADDPSADAAADDPSADAAADDL